MPEVRLLPIGARQTSIDPDRFEMIGQTSADGSETISAVIARGRAGMHGLQHQYSIDMRHRFSRSLQH